MTFVKGKSGNPSGRPKELSYLKELAQKHTIKAVETLVDVMNNSPQDKDRAFAADKLLDRGYGKPGQAVEVTGKDGSPIIPVINIGIPKPK